MKIVVIAVGKLKTGAGFKDIDNFYSKRIKIYSQLEIIELKEKNCIENETESIIKAIPCNSFIIALRETGSMLDSKGFAKLINDKNQLFGQICFVIGGAYGFNSVNENLSLSIAPWTLPHQLARINLLEQIYRGLSILNKSAYHHS